MITSIVSLQSTLSDSKAGPSAVVELGHISQTTDIGTPIEEDFTRKAALDYVLWLQAILRVLSSAPGNLENSVTKVLVPAAFSESNKQHMVLSHKSSELQPS